MWGLCGGCCYFVLCFAKKNPLQKKNGKILRIFWRPFHFMSSSRAQNIEIIHGFFIKQEIFGQGFPAFKIQIPRDEIISPLVTAAHRPAIPPPPPNHSLTPIFWKMTPSTPAAACSILVLAPRYYFTRDSTPVVKFSPSLNRKSSKTSIIFSRGSTRNSNLRSVKIFGTYMCVY